MEEEEAEERAMLSRRESALEALDADSPTRVEEAEEVTPLKNSYPSTNMPFAEARSHNTPYLQSSVRWRQRWPWWR